MNAVAAVDEPTETFPAKVLVAVVEVAVTIEDVKLPAKYPFPLTSKALDGEEVPMPRRLLVLSQKKLALF